MDLPKAEQVRIAGWVFLRVQLTGALAAGCAPAVATTVLDVIEGTPGNLVNAPLLLWTTFPVALILAVACTFVPTGLYSACLPQIVLSRIRRGLPQWRDHAHSWLFVAIIVYGFLILLATLSPYELSREMIATFSWAFLAAGFTGSLGVVTCQRALQQLEH
jgi:hypothetical protein